MVVTHAEDRELEHGERLQEGLVTVIKRRLSPALISAAASEDSLSMRLPAFTSVRAQGSLALTST